MDGVHPGPFGNVNDTINAQVAVPRWRGADGVGFVGVTHVKGSPVHVGVDGHGLETELPTGAENAHSDLATVSN